MLRFLLTAALLGAPLLAQGPNRPSTALSPAQPSPNTSPARIALTAISAQSLPCDSTVKVQTDSLRAETERRSTTTGLLLAVRRTVVRRLATRIDSLAASAACTQTTPQPPAEPFLHDLLRCAQRRERAAQLPLAPLLPPTTRP